MDVKACDNCKKLNIDTDKPFALVGPSMDYNNPTEDKAMLAVYISTHSILSEKYKSKDAKMLCNDCTMPYATELIKKMFSTENYSKL